MSASPGFAARALMAAVRVYQTFFSALMPSACKFYPTCSHYAADAVRLHGARRGAWLALRRLSRCHPFTRGGVDFVPEPVDRMESPRPAYSVDDHPVGDRKVGEEANGGKVHGEVAS